MNIDYRNPDYTAILKQRAERLAAIRTNPRLLVAAKVHYKSHPWDFISDWGMTYEPRNLEIGRPATIPFVLFERQIQLLKWIHKLWEGRQNGLIEKSRDCGASWVTMAYAVTMCLFWPGYSAGFGSRKEKYVDDKGNPDSLFEKGRLFLKYLPRDFLPLGFDMDKHATYMAIENPENVARITGDSGDNIGRGARTSIYFVDEAAHVPRQNLIDAALSSTTNCQIDMSSVNGPNRFYEKKMSARIPVFIFDWRDDPRKSDAWYQDYKSKHPPEIVAQEVDRDYFASREDVFIPGKWVAATIDAHKKLGFRAEGAIRTAFDPADVGDARGHMVMHGSVVVEAIAQKEGNITHAVSFAEDLADERRAEYMVYDADGMGSPVAKLSFERSIGTRVDLVPFHGSGKVEDPEGEADNGRTNKDRYKNLRDQMYSRLRERFRKTYEAVENGVYTDPSDLISISSGCKDYLQLQAELSSPERKRLGDGKVRIESKVDMKARGVKSTNIADCLMMLQKTPEENQHESVSRLRFASLY